MELGGGSAIKLADKINKSKEFCIKTVDILATIDPVDKGRRKGEGLVVPSNVNQFHNWYQTKGPGVPLKFHGRHYPVEKGVVDLQKDLNSDGKGKSANYKVDGDAMVIDHMSIVLEVSSDLIALMNNK